MICKNCSNLIPNESLFCPTCGTPVDNSESQESNGQYNTNQNTHQQFPINTPQSQPQKKKKKNKKGLIIGIVLAAILLFAVIGGIVGSAGKNSSEDDFGSGIADENYIPNYNTGIQMTDNLFDYQIKIGETVYQFPMSVEDFKKTGLTYSEYEDPTDKISSGRKDLVWFSYPDGSKINARLVNFSKSETEYDNCTVVGISVSNDTYNIKFDPTKISTAKGITLNLSTTDDIIAAFGRPSDEWISNDKSTIKYTYEEDIYKTIEFHFNGSTKTLTDIDFENVEKPDNITEKGPSNQIPQLVKDYKQPTALGTDITSGVVELDKVLYKLPLPVSELIKNGWKITEKSQDTIPGRDYAHISLSKGNIELENISIRNYEEYETTLENGIIEEFTTTKLTHTEKNRLILPRNINTEMGESDFVKATKDLTVNKKESKYYVTYQITNGNISASITFENGIMRYFSLYWAKP